MEKQMNFKRGFLTLVVALLLPSLAMAGTTSLATFLTDFDYNDNNQWDDADVNISCTGGLPLNSGQDVMDGDEITFVLEFPEEGPKSQTDCHIFADDFNTDEYHTHYDCDGDTSCESDDDDGCWFFDVQDGEDNYCDVDLDPNDAYLRVNKEWNLIGSVGVRPDFDARVTVCTDQQGVIKGDHYSPRTGRYCVTQTLYGPQDDYFDVTFDDPQHEGDTVYIFERTFDSAVEVDRNNCGSYIVKPGDDRECTIINTVFYEGIPTLNQYGLALMALLMLGVGFVGFRRFV